MNVDIFAKTFMGTVGGSSTAGIPSDLKRELNQYGGSGLLRTATLMAKSGMIFILINFFPLTFFCFSIRFVMHTSFYNGHSQKVHTS